MTHDDFHNLMNAYLAGGLGDGERTAVAAHAAGCPACAAALEQAEAADRELDELFAAARPDGGLEDRVVARLRAVRRPPMVLHPLVRRAAVGVAATVLLGGAGFAVTQAEQGGGSLFSLFDAAPDIVIRDNQAGHAVFYGDLKNATGSQTSVETPAQMAQRLAEEVRGGAARPAPETGRPADEGSRVQRVRQEVTHRFDSAIGTAKSRVATGRPDDFGAARVALDQARLARASNATVFKPETLEGWDARIRETELALAEAERRAVDQSEAGAAETIRGEIARSEQESVQARERTVDDLVRTSRRLTRDARYGEAKGVVDQILVLDPANEYATGVRPLMEERVAQKQQQQLRERVSGEVVNSLNRAEDPAATNDDILRYPTDWPEISAARDQTAAATRFGMAAADGKSRGKPGAESERVGDAVDRKEVKRAEAEGTALSKEVVPATPGQAAAGDATLGVRFYKGDANAAAGATAGKRVEGRLGEMAVNEGVANRGEAVRESVQDASKARQDAQAAVAPRPNDAVALFSDGHAGDWSLEYGALRKGGPGVANGSFRPGDLYARAESGERFNEQGQPVRDWGDSYWRYGGQSGPASGPPAAAEGAAPAGDGNGRQQLVRAEGGTDVNEAEPGDAKKLAERGAQSGETEGKPDADGVMAGDADDYFLAARAGAGDGEAKGSKDAAARSDQASQSDHIAQAVDMDPAPPEPGVTELSMATAAKAEAEAQPDGEGKPAATPALAQQAPEQKPPADAQPAGEQPVPQAQQAPQPKPPTAEDLKRRELEQRAARKVIRNGEMSFEVDGYDSSVVQINKIAAEEGGFVATTESEKLPNGKVKGSVVVRVPPERLDTLVLKLRGLGDLKNSRISAQDVTKQFTDLAAQLKAATTMETRLLQIIESGKGEVKDLLEAEKQLGTWRERIEALQGEINYYNNLVSLSTLTVGLIERDIRQSALLSESEQVNMGVEAADVEVARAEALKAIDDAKGRVVESDLKTHDAGQYVATITAEVAPDAAGPVIDRLKQVGRVARLDVQRRRETAEGAPPAPGARLERRDTRLHVSIYNLANVAPRVSTNLNLAADDVEKAYRAVLEQVASAGGRVVTSNLTKPTPEQTSGTVEFHVPTEAADVLLAAVRGAGEVMRLESSTNADVQNSTDAKRGFRVEVRALALVSPRETTTLQVAARDIAASFNALREAVRTAGGRVFTSQLAEQGDAAVTSQLDFDVRRDDLPAVQAALDAAGVAVSRNVNRSTDAENTVDTKVRFQVTFVDERAVPARETVTLSVAVDDVAARYEALVDALRDAGARVTDARIDVGKPNEASASFSVDIRQADRATVDKLLADAGGVYGRSVARPGEGQAVLADKVRLAVTLSDVDNLAPRESTTLGVEVADVWGAVSSIETTAIALGGRKVDSDSAQDTAGRNVARVVVDVPLSKSAELLTRAQQQGRVTTVQREQDPAAPEGPFSRARLTVTVGTSDPILQRDQGLGASVRAGLSTSVYWLLKSVTLIVIGLCLVAPFAIALWLAWRFWRFATARRRNDRGAAAGPTPPAGPAATPAV